MSDIIERTFKCTGCGEARPCTLKTTQAKAEIEFFDPAEYLKCVLDETNKTATNWKEAVANEADKDNEPSINYDGLLGTVVCPNCKTKHSNGTAYCSTCIDNYYKSMGL